MAKFNYDEIPNFEDADIAALIAEENQKLTNPKSKSAGKNPNKKSRKVPVSRDESIERQAAAALQRSYSNQDADDDKIKQRYVPDDRTYLIRHKDMLIKNFKNTNKRIKYVKERIKILESEMRKYYKAGNDEAVAACKEELALLKQEQKVTESAFHKVTSKDVIEAFVRKDTIEITNSIEAEKLNLKEAQNNGASKEEIDVINQNIVALKEKLQEADTHNTQLDELDAIKQTIAELREKKRTTDFTKFNELMKDIKREIDAIKKHGELDIDLEDFIEAGGINKDLEKAALIKYFSQKETEATDIDNIEDSEFINSIAEINSISVINEMTLENKINAFARLIYLILPNMEGVTFNSIRNLIITDNRKMLKALIDKYKDRESVNTIDKEIAKLNERKNTLIHRLKKRGFIVDFITDYLHYDENDDEEQMVAKELLVAMTIDWARTTVNSIIKKYEIKDSSLIADCEQEALLIISEYANKWFAERSKGNKFEWYNYISMAVYQGVRKFIAGWRNYGTISGTNVKTVEFKRRKTYERIKKAFLENPDNKNLIGKDGTANEWIEDYIWSLVDREEMTLMNIETASTTEARIGSRSGDEQKVDFGNFMSKSEYDDEDYAEIKIYHDSLIKNMVALFSALDTTGSFNRRRKRKDKLSIFDDLDLLIIKLQLGIIHKPNGTPYIHKECFDLCNEWMKKTGYRLGSGNGFFGGTEKPSDTSSSEYQNWNNRANSSYSGKVTDLFGNERLRARDIEKHRLWEITKVGEEPEIRILKKGKFYDFINSDERYKKAWEELRMLIGNKFMGQLELTPEELETEIDNGVLIARKKHNENSINQYVDLDIALGDDELDNVEDITSAYSEMIDFTGLKL